MDLEQSVPLSLALKEFNAYLIELDHQTVQIWGNGADFDNSILAAAYRACRIEPAWKFSNNRCYRTLKGLYPADKLKRQGIYHNALDEAKSQAVHAIALLRKFYAPQDELEALRKALRELQLLNSSQPV